MRAPRSLLRAATVAIALAAPAAALAAASWSPDQAIEIVVGTSAGSGSDTTGRWMQRWMREKKLVGVPVNVVNKPGGGGTIAATYINQHPGNGHYLLVSSPSLLTNFITGRGAIRYSDLTPLAQVGAESVVFTVRADSPLKSALDLAQRLKADPASLSFSIGIAIGSHNHIATAEVAKSQGADIRKLKVVAFSGSADGVTALLGGHIDVSASPASAVLAHVKAGKLRTLAVSSEQRLTGDLATVPTWTELGIRAISSNWRSVVGPQGMSEQQVAYWDDVLSRLVRLPEWRQDLDARLVEATYLNSRDVRRRMDAEHALLTAVLTELGLAK
jgi:putative tricarboxylic transport membrane protein